MKKAGLYIRVSTAEQNEHGYSVDEQRERLIAYCKAMGWEIAGIYVDGGYSGKDTNRPAIQKLMSEIKLLDAVVIYKLDRLSRSQKDTLSLIEDVFMKNNVDIVSLQENLDTSTPFGRAAIGILSAFSQLERETIKERAMLGKTGRAKKGKWIGTARPPIGYEYSTITQQLTINSYEAEQVKLVFDMYLKGTGRRKIAEYMKSNGYKHKYGDWTRWGGVITMLQNVVYTGKVTFSGKEYDGQHEPIITGEQFKDTQKMLGIRSDQQPYKRKSPFSHLLYCDECGSKMFYNNKNGKYPKYYCYSRANNPFGKDFKPGCAMKIWNVHEVDQIILSEIYDLAEDNSTIDSILTRKKKRKNIIPALEKKISDIEKQSNKLLDLYQYSSIPVDSLNERIRLLHEEKNKIDGMILLENQSNEINVEEISDMRNSAMKIKKEWDSLAVQQKIILLNRLIVRIIVGHDTLHIQWKFSNLANE